MGVTKCPRCEINFIKEEDGVCAICRRELKGEAPKEDPVELCVECGEHPGVPGEELCIFCLKERELADTLVKSTDAATVDVPDDEDIELDDNDIPEQELEQIHKEFGIDEVEVDDADFEPEVDFEAEEDDDFDNLGEDDRFEEDDEEDEILYEREF